MLNWPQRYCRYPSRFQNKINTWSCTFRCRHRCQKLGHFAVPESKSANSYKYNTATLHLCISFAMASREVLSNFGKKVVGYPEEDVPITSTLDWTRNLTGNPKRKVSLTTSSLMLFSVLTVPQGDRLCPLLVSYTELDKTI